MMFYLQDDPGKWLLHCAFGAKGNTKETHSRLMMMKRALLSKWGLCLTNDELAWVKKLAIKGGWKEPKTTREAAHA